MKLPLELIRPGIREAVEVFWRHVDARTPPVLKPEDRFFVTEALLVALGRLNVERDKGME